MVPWSCHRDQFEACGHSLVPRGSGEAVTLERAREVVQGDTVDHPGTVIGDAIGAGAVGEGEMAGMHRVVDGDGDRCLPPHR